MSAWVQWAVVVVVCAAVGVSVGLLTGDWATAVRCALGCCTATFVIDAVRRLRASRDDAARYSTPGPWGTPT
jgi:hypothetical protein